MNFHPNVFVMLILLAGLGAPPAEQQSSQQGTTTISPEQIQRVHSQLHHEGLSRQIPEMLSQTTGDVELRTGRAPAMTVQLDPASELANLACESDLVVVGQTGKGVSHMTADQGYIYTDWDFTVEDVLKNNAKAPAHAGSVIEVTRPGGNLLISGRKVSANSEHFPNFHQGEELILYLRFIPKTGAYLLANPSGFAFAEGKTQGLSRGSLRPEFEASDKARMLNQVKASIATSAADANCGGKHQ